MVARTLAWCVVLAGALVSVVLLLIYELSTFRVGCRGPAGQINLAGTKGNFIFYSLLLDSHHLR